MQLPELVDSILGRGGNTRGIVHLRKLANFAVRYVKQYFQKGRFTAPALPKVSIETTNICNAACVFCANPVMERKKQPLDMAAFEKTIDEFAAMGGTAIDFNATIGDPLLDPKVLQRARYVRKYPQFKSLGFVTTLEWLHRFPLDDFFSSGIDWLAVSITLSGREKYREFFGVDLYDRTMQNLIMLLEENERRGHPISVTLAIKPTNEPLADVLAHPDFKKIAAMVAPHQDLVATANNTGFYVDDWIGAVKLPQYLKKRPLYPRAFRPCQLLYAGLMVYSNGNVGACACRDFEASSELILGNVKETSMNEMWTGKKLRVIREDWRLKNKVPEICQSCRHYLY